jgi:peptide chain release factor subunit 1
MSGVMPDRDVIRRLAEVELPDGAVLSIYIDLDPSEFATADARSSAITSALNEADKAVSDSEGARDLDHDARQALREDVERAREYLESADFDGTRAIAIFAAGSASLFEALHLPQPVETSVSIDTTPQVAPLAAQADSGTWLVVLANRSSGRLLRGGPDGLREEGVVDDDVHGQHQQGGWSQARYERSVDEDVRRHLERVAKAVAQRHERAPFDNLLVGGPEDAYSEFVDLLDQKMQGLLAGRVDVDVENTNADAVTEAAVEAMRAHEEKVEVELLARLAAGLGRGGRAAAGVDDVLSSLNEQRVETLLLDAGFSAPGAQCPQCGWIGAQSEGECPADGTELESRPNLADLAVEHALAQDAKVISLRDRAEMEPHGGLAALLRF